MRRGSDQAGLAALAVVPSLVALAVVVGTLGAGKLGVPSERYYAWAHIVLAVAIMGTLPVDARLERDGEAPPGWTRFRLALSLGLALLTAAAGVTYAATTVTVTYI